MFSKLLQLRLVVAFVLSSTSSLLSQHASSSSHSVVVLVQAAATTAAPTIRKCGLSIPASAISTRPKKVIIAHRGASYHVPEHTLAAYQLALELGADYIEPDLVGTKDGHLVAIHTMDLTVTTDVRQVFPHRNATYSAHVNQTGYWVFDYTLAELKRLRVKQRLPEHRSTAYDGLFSIPTLGEIVSLVQTWNTVTLPAVSRTDENTTTTPPSQRAGIYAELKDPAWYQAETNVSLTEMLHQTLLLNNDYYSTIQNDTACANLRYNEYLVPLLVVQCFDGNTLTQVHQLLPTVPLVLLMTSSECGQDEVWFRVGELGEHLSGVGPDKACLTPLHYRDFMNRAKEHELVVHAWTERPELTALLPNGTKEEDEINYLLCTVGVDGLFTEDVSTMKRIVQKNCDSPTPQPTASPDASSCPPGPKNLTAEYGVAAGIMGLLIGSVAAVWLLTSQSCTKCCGRKGRGPKRQLRIPQHDDLEMI